jgi:CRP-like cAMP-binding protein
MTLGLISGSLVLRNELLAGLPAEEVERLRPHLRHVSLVMGQVLQEADAPVEYVFFPQEGLVSVIADTCDNGAVEAGLTGREGMLGASVLLAPEAPAAQRAIVQAPGHAVRMAAPALREAVEHCPVLRDRCLRHVQVMLVQAAQGAACNARHELPERLARWLLMTRDRLDTDDLPMRQDFLAQMLGVRRAGVSVVATALQSTGTIRQGRGRIVILDRAGLEDQACNCYRLIEDNRRRIMGGAK